MRANVGSTHPLGTLGSETVLLASTLAGSALAFALGMVCLFSKISDTIEGCRGCTDARRPWYSPYDYLLWLILGAVVLGCCVVYVCFRFFAAKYKKRRCALLNLARPQR